MESFLLGQSFPKFLIRQLEAIKFASDWRQRSKRPGIKKFKRDFVQRTFEDDPTHSELRSDGTAEEQDVYKKNFSAFKLKHSKMITARNYLLQLYELVSVLTICSVF